MGVVEFGKVKLKDGEMVSCTRVVGPDAEWAPAIEKFLKCWSDPWVIQALNFAISVSAC